MLRTRAQYVVSHTKDDGRKVVYLRNLGGALRPHSVTPGLSDVPTFPELRVLSLKLFAFALVGMGQAKQRFDAKFGDDDMLQAFLPPREVDEDEEGRETRTIPKVGTETGR